MKRMPSGLALVGRLQTKNNVSQRCERWMWEEKERRTGQPTMLCPAFQLVADGKGIVGLPV